ncbi:MAG: hypothetical protein JWO20_3263 [Candidatus Angelobacter sp.]|jgi:hypothetical protein|nr:hypothetical protein [Candidatus Angelobacter sp.]
MTDRELLGPELNQAGTHAVIVHAASLYRRHFRLFASLVVLPTFAGTFLLALSRIAIFQIRNSLPSDLASQLRAIRTTYIVLEIGAINVAGFLGLWLCWAFAFASVTVAINTILREVEADAEDCFSQVREHPGRFLVTSGYLFFKMLFLSYVVGIVGFLWWTTITDHFELQPHAYVVSSVIVLIIAALTLPFLLALPVATLENRGLVASLKRSFALTEGKSLVMLGLFFETEISAYLFSWILNWLVYRGFTGQGIPIFYGGVFYFQLIVSAFFQPIVMIGFAWIYAMGVQSLQRSEDANDAGLQGSHAI